MNNDCEYNRTLAEKEREHLERLRRAKQEYEQVILELQRKKEELAMVKSQILQLLWTRTSFN